MKQKIILYMICLISMSNVCYGEFVVPMYETDSVLVVLRSQSDIYKYVGKTGFLVDLYENKYIIPAHNINKIESNDIIFQSVVLNSRYNERFAMDNCIILYEVNDLPSLIKENNLSEFIIDVDSIPPLYYIHFQNLSTDKVTEICTLLQENKYCNIAEPNYWILSASGDSTAINPSTNPKFSLQWGLYNSPSSNYDVNAIEAWQHSTGQNVKVAVIDCGFQLNHPDLFDNIFASYDCTDGLDGSVNGQCMIPNDSHGTQCAGVIAAVNNNVGVIGIAPNVDLLTIRDNYSTINSDSSKTYHGNAIWTINAIKKAYQSGADVISCSWSYHSYNSNVYNSCINSATSQGRNGKGCVVVFSTGNQASDTINYPTNLPTTIAVGSSKQNGQKAWFSNYGNGLDIVAPGEIIWTTQTIEWGSYVYSSGTSMACPMVAGVAALILSVNPDLTWQEVRSIIRQTAYKLPAYTFDSITSDGSWNKYVGHGLVDANAAVIRAGTKWIQNKTYSNNSYTNQRAVNLYAGYSVTNSQPYGNVIVKSGSSVVYQATNHIILEPGFTAEEGSFFKAEITDVYHVPLYIREHTDYLADYTEESNKEIENNIIQASKDFALSPNPANDIITITSQEQLENIRIYSITGQCVLQAKQTDINVSALPAGIYIVTATTTVGNTLQSKFVHQ